MYKHSYKSFYALQHSAEKFQVVFYIFYESLNIMLYVYEAPFAMITFKNLFFLSKMWSLGHNNFTDIQFLERKNNFNYRNVYASLIKCYTNLQTPTSVSNLNPGLLRTDFWFIGAPPWRSRPRTVLDVFTLLVTPFYHAISKQIKIFTMQKPTTLIHQ